MFRLLAVVACRRALINDVAVVDALVVVAAVAAAAALTAISGSAGCSDFQSFLEKAY